MSTSRYRELLAQKAELDHAIAEAQSEESAKAVETCRELIEQYGLRPEDLFGKARKVHANKGQSRAAVPPKYRNTETGETWSGRGKAPRWLGENRNAFLIPEISEQE